MCINSTWLETRITAVQAQIDAYESAILALGTGNIQWYDLDTGQTRQRVTKLDLGDLNNVLGSLYNRFSMLCVRKNGTGVTISKPGW
jgi:hypothetical protein